MHPQLAVPTHLPDSGTQDVQNPVRAGGGLLHVNMQHVPSQPPIYHNISNRKSSNNNSNNNQQEEEGNKRRR